MVDVRGAEEDIRLSASSLTLGISTDACEALLELLSFWLIAAAIAAAIAESAGGVPACEPEGDGVSEVDLLERSFKKFAALSLLALASGSRVGLLTSA